MDCSQGETIWLESALDSLFSQGVYSTPYIELAARYASGAFGLVISKTTFSVQFCFLSLPCLLLHPVIPRRCLFYVFCIRSSVLDCVNQSRDSLQFSRLSTS